MYRDIIDDINNISSSCVMDFHLKEYHDGRINPLAVRIKALEDAGGGGAGKNGRELELKKGLFPDDPSTPDIPDNYAVMWRLKAREGEVEDPWKLLILFTEIKGDKGDTGEAGAQGPKGDPGKGLVIKGFVTNVSDLYSLTGVLLGDAYLVTATSEVYIANKDNPSTSSDWENLGAVHGIKGDKGDKGDTGARGATGPKGADGSVSSILISWIVDTATNQAINQVTLTINDAVNDAITTLTNQLASLAEDAAETAVGKAIDEMMDQFKGDKGEKGDKGDKGSDGKDGAACTIKGHFDTELELTTMGVQGAGNAYLVGTENILFMWIPNVVSGVDVGSWKNVGNIKGPKGDKGDDGNMSIQLLDKRDTLVGSPIKVIPTEGDTPNLFIKGSGDIILETPLAGVTGFNIKTRYPIPTLVPTGNAATTTADKFLTNNGTNLEWVDISMEEVPKPKVLLQSPNGTVFAITVTDDGRLEVNKEVIK